MKNGLSGSMRLVHGSAHRELKVLYGELGHGVIFHPAADTQAPLVSSWIC